MSASDSPSVKPSKTLGTRLRTLEGWTLRERVPAGSGPAVPAPAVPAQHPLVLMIHGWTGDENSMWVFSPRLPANAWLVAPRAPYQSTRSGYSWRNDQIETGRWSTFAELSPAANRLIELLTPENFPGADLSQIGLVGFSQGGALAYTLALLHPQRVARLAALSTFLPAGAEVLALREPLQGIPVLIAHGTQDTMVPLSMAYEAMEHIEQAGAQVEYCENDVGHKLGAACFCALEDFFR